MRHRDDHVLDGNQVFELDFRLLLDDLGAPHVAVVLLDLLELVHDEFLERFFAGQNSLVLRDFLLQLVVLLLDFFALERREALQLHFQNRLRLALGELEPRHQALAGLGGRL